jgi:transcriptional regulator of arginine metabolism
LKTNIKESRHNLIKKYIKHSKVRSQEELVKHLQLSGFAVTQATISRDIADLGLIKTKGGFYALAEDEELKSIFQTLVKEVKYSGNMVVVNTLPAAAQTVARYIDSASVSEVLGSVAGDDAIFLLITEDVSAKKVADKLLGYKEEG